jgi:hypothetical protein
MLRLKSNWMVIAGALRGTRRHRGNTRDGRELALDRTGHGCRHRVGAGAGQRRGNSDGREINLGQRRDRQQPESENAERDDGRRNQRRHHGSADTKLRQVHKRVSRSVVRLTLQRLPQRTADRKDTRKLILSPDPSISTFARTSLAKGHECQNRIIRLRPCCHGARRPCRSSAATGHRPRRFHRRSSRSRSPTCPEMYDQPSQAVPAPCRP